MASPLDSEFRCLLSRWADAVALDDLELAEQWAEAVFRLFDFAVEKVQAEKEEASRLGSQGW